MSTHISNYLSEFRQNPAGRMDYFIRPTDYIDCLVLAANVAETWTKPSSIEFILINGTVAFYYKKDGTAAVPAADVTDGSGSFLNPEQLDVRETTTLGLIAPTDGVVTIAGYIT